MGIPRKLKNMNAHVDGQGYLGIVSEYEEPMLAIATEDYRGGGMIGSVKIDLGVEPMEATLKMGGHEARLIRKFGTKGISCQASAIDSFPPSTCPTLGSKPTMVRIQARVLLIGPSSIRRVRSERSLNGRSGCMPRTTPRNSE